LALFHTVWSGESSALQPAFEQAAAALEPPGWQASTALRSLTSPSA
jgi:hypothetical protein